MFWLSLFRLGILAFGGKLAARPEIRALDIHLEISADSPFLRIRNESSRLQAISCFCGVSMPSFASCKVPWWIAMLVLAARISWARTASSGAMCTADINQRGSYVPMGNNASCSEPKLSRILAK